MKTILLFIASVFVMLSTSGLYGIEIKGTGMTITSISNKLDSTYLKKTGDTAGTLTVSNLTTVGTINPYPYSNFIACDSAGVDNYASNAVMIGRYCGNACTGVDFIAIGKDSGYRSLFRHDVIAIGHDAGGRAHEAVQSIFIGRNTGRSIDALCNGTTMIGSGVGYYGHGYNLCTMVGEWAGGLRGEKVDAFGYRAGYDTYATNCLFLGYEAGMGKTELENKAFLGDYTLFDMHNADITNAIYRGETNKFPDIAWGDLGGTNALTDSVYLRDDDAIAMAGAQGVWIEPDGTGSNGYFSTIVPMQLIIDGLIVNGGLVVSNDITATVGSHTFGATTFSQPPQIQGAIDSALDASTKGYVDNRTNFYGTVYRAGEWAGQIWGSNGYARIWDGASWQ